VSSPDLEDADPRPPSLSDTACASANAAFACATSTAQMNNSTANRIGITRVIIADRSPRRLAGIVSCFVENTYNWGAKAISVVELE